MRIPAVIFGLVVLILTGCTENQPIRLGFLGGLTGRVADLGEAGRDGALFAIEEVNAAGGVNGRRIELLIQDDQQDAKIAAMAAQTLLDARVDAIIGPMTSAMGEAISPVLARADRVMVSPTITSSQLAGKDDLLFRVAPPVSESTQRSAVHAYRTGSRRVAIVYDLNNLAYSADWAAHFRRAFSAVGGSVVAEASFTSGQDASYGEAVKKVAAAKPDALHFVANAVDTVRLTQLSRNMHLDQPVTTSTWAATESLIQLGGRTVEGMTLTQFFDRANVSPRYQGFADSFRKRFRQEPGFASVAAYDSTRAVLFAMEKSPQRPLKQALLESGPYQGLQTVWNFDRFGDAQRQTHIAIVRDGHFVVTD
jgi:branched-chain amino acid transport system substrate-binding protein